jgi:hypothetical protein
LESGSQTMGEATNTEFAQRVRSPKTALPIANEACSEKMPLDYATGKSWIQWGNNTSNRTEFAATQSDWRQHTAHCNWPAWRLPRRLYMDNEPGACLWWWWIRRRNPKNGVHSFLCVSRAPSASVPPSSEKTISHMRAGTSLNAAETVPAFEQNSQVLDAGCTL